MFLSRGDRVLGVAFQTHPGRQTFISSGSKEPRSALEWNRYEKNCELVLERPMEMQNSYFMINPHGEVYINAFGLEKKYGNSIYEPLSEIFSRLPFDMKKFDLRYEDEEV